MENLEVYEMARSVPENAQRTISGGDIDGFTDINPMWRIKKLTEIFGTCGFGWWYEITNKWMETAPNGEIRAFVDVNLYVKDKETGEVSQPIQGTGGNRFYSIYSKRVKVSDECYKMALTDALSVAAKALGIGADVYWEQDKTKYSNTTQEESAKSTNKTTKTEDTDKERVAKGVEKIAKTIEELQEKNVSKSAIADCIKKHYSVNGKPSANYKKITDIKLLLEVYKELEGLKGESNESV